MQKANLKARIGRLILAMASLAATGSAQAQSTQQMSPAGRAVFENFYRRPHKIVVKCLEDHKRVESQLIDAALQPVFDWPAAKALLEEQFEIQQHCAKRAHNQTIELMDRLSASDRAIYFRSFHLPISAPSISSKP